jgi:hypothetical protein
MKNIRYAESAQLHRPINKSKDKALRQLIQQPRIADEMKPEWKYEILLEKLEHLREATNREDIGYILAEPTSQKNLFKIPLNSEYWMLKEEALWWMKWSLEAPLSQEGLERYMYVFKMLYPDKVALIS